MQQHLIFQSIFPNSKETLCWLFQWSSAAPQQLSLTQPDAAVPGQASRYGCWIPQPPIHRASERKCWYCIVWFNIRIYIYIYVNFFFNQMISNPSIIWLWLKTCVHRARVDESWVLEAQEGDDEYEEDEKYGDENGDEDDELEEDTTAQKWGRWWQWGWPAGWGCEADEADEDARMMRIRRMNRTPRTPIMDPKRLI